MLIDYLGWNEAQRKEYTEKEITITLMQLGVFVHGYQVLSGAGHLNNEEAKTLGDIIATLFSTYLKTVMEITHDDSLLR